MTDEEMTCGRGIAANATLPSQMAVVVAALGAVLQDHTKALDDRNAAARREHAAYDGIIESARVARISLDALAREMLACRELPAAPHDMDALASRETHDVFVALVRAEQQLHGLLQRRGQDHDAMLEPNR